MTTKKGFTLIELLIVVAIIAILVAVSFAGLGAVRERARLGSMQAEMNNLRPVLLLCLEDHSPIIDPAEGGLVCQTQATTWPRIEGTWGGASVDGSNNNYSNFEFSATYEGKTVSCSLDECVTTP